MLQIFELFLRCLGPAGGRGEAAGSAQNWCDSDRQDNNLQVQVVGLGLEVAGRQGRHWQLRLSLSPGPYWAALQLPALCHPRLISDSD